VQVVVREPFGNDGVSDPALDIQVDAQVETGCAGPNCRRIIAEFRACKF
jgi:hypothetical protein